MVARGQKGYNGVAILSKLPMVEAGAEDFANLGHARHIAGQLENGVVIHNFYVPAGGDAPDREVNEKFGQKLDYLTDMRDAFAASKPERSILVGDLNIAPREDDVWQAIGSMLRAQIFLKASFIAGGHTAPKIGRPQTRAAVSITFGPHQILPHLHLVHEF